MGCYRSSGFWFWFFWVGVGLLPDDIFWGAVLDCTGVFIRLYIAVTA